MGVNVGSSLFGVAVITIVCSPQGVEVEVEMKSEADDPFSPSITAGTK
jgi:hypothetical protein